MCENVQKKEEVAPVVIFKYVEKYFHDLNTYLSNVNRHELTEELEKDAQEIIEFSKRCENIEFFPKDKPLYRARKGVAGFNEKTNSDIPYPIMKMGIPPKEKRKGSRAAPTGIECLYLSQNQQTAVMETRPWIGKEVSVAKFLPKEDLKLVNFTSINIKNPNDKKELLWWYLNFYFSAPVDDNEEDYLLTQYFSQRFKANGFDGIMYKSSIDNDPGARNIALFSDTKVKGQTTTVCCSITGIEYEISPTPILL